MKKVFTLVMALAVMISSTFGSFVTYTSKEAPTKASEFYIPLGNTGKQISLLKLSNISSEELQQLTGKKMNLLEKFSLKMTQKKLKKSINEDGTINTKSLDKLSAAAAGSTSGFSLAGFLLGLFLSVIGVLIAYLIDGSGSAMVKWSWIGALVGLAIWILIAVV